jgi:predicted N-formylglutamate amidohydrolase
MGNSAAVLQREDYLPADRRCVLITCEHGGNGVPEDFAALFRSVRKLLESHRGYDAGALHLAKELAQSLEAPLFFSEVTRLLVDLNRSPDNPGRFSEITKPLAAEEKAAIENRCYTPYRNAVQSALHKCIRKHGLAVHISVHTFTPVLDGKVRTADLGILYDPSRRDETAFCIALQKTLSRLRPDLKIRRNYPYRGTADGFTAHLRRLFPEGSYLGIELEVNQKILEDRSSSLKLRQALLQSLAITLRSM